MAAAADPRHDFVDVFDESEERKNPNRLLVSGIVSQALKAEDSSPVVGFCDFDWTLSLIRSGDVMTEFDMSLARFVWREDELSESQLDQFVSRQLHHPHCPCRSSPLHPFHHLRQVVKKNGLMSGLSLDHWMASHGVGSQSHQRCCYSHC
jgi:hypothetical protein